MQKAYIPVLVIPAAKFKWFLASWYTCILKSNSHIKGTKIKHKKKCRLSFSYKFDKKW